MNPEVKAKWLAALRSGKYQQTVEFLHDSDGYCCLGVLTDLYIKEKGEEWQLQLQIETDFYYFEYEEQNLPHSVIKWSGLNSCDPDVVYKGDKTCLTGLNDEHELNFKEIADVIEEQL